MARFSSIISGCALALAVTAAQGQTARPAPMRQGSPAPNEVQQIRQQPQMGQPQQAGPQQQMGQQQQQQAARPADPPANTPPPPDTPPSPPEVTYRNGMLTVHAINSTLGSVIAAIKSKTGIEFDGAENSPDRVAISQGPAPSGEVLASIFAGSKYDFVAIGRPDSPDVVQRVILSPRKSMGATMAAQKPTPANNGQDSDGDEDTPDETVNAGEPQDTAVQPPPQPEQAQQQNQPQNQQQTQPKTPEQLMQELQEMQKQQQQQQQGATNPAQVPRKQPPL